VWTSARPLDQFFSVRGSHVVVEANEGLFGFRVPARGRIAALLSQTRLDARLAAGEPPEASVELAIRADQLVRPRACLRLARTLAWISSQPSAPMTIRATPICGRAVRDVARELTTLGRRLSAKGPISARGIAQLRILIADGSGPLYSPGRPVELRTRLDLAAIALDPMSASGN
jgi:hypothetical protein